MSITRPRPDAPGFDDPWVAAQAQLGHIADLVGLDPGLRDVLAACRRAVVVSVPVKMDDGSTRVFEGFRVTHNIARGPSKGGIRYHPSVSLEAMRALAMQMTWKCSLMGLPFGGAKGGVVCDPHTMSEGELERMTRRYTSEIVNLIGPEVDIPAPDIGTDSRVMAWIFDTYSMNKGYSVLGVVTGKPQHLGGSVGRAEAPARGAAFCIREAARKRGQEPADLRVAIQGFGTVGRNVALWLAGDGATIVALSDSRGAVHAPGGIDVDAAVAHKRTTGRLAGLPGTEAITQDDLLTLECDVLVPAAGEHVLTVENAERVRASIVCEGANAPTTVEADEILHERGVLVLPDVLANAGGVVVSYFEWVQGLQEYFWKEPEVNSKLNEVVTRAFTDVWRLHEERGVSLRDAAWSVAVGRVAEATHTRGLYP